MSIFKYFISYFLLNMFFINTLIDKIAKKIDKITINLNYFFIKNSYQVKILYLRFFYDILFTVKL